MYILNSCLSPAQLLELLLLYQLYVSCLCLNIISYHKITKSVDFYSKRYVFLRNILFENDLTLAKNNDINCQMFSWSIIFSI